jgi:glutamate formiminotransferase/formiminotetrahydrofolate cyclodeaminase
MNEAIIECVPNFSEGRDTALIRQITDRIESVAAVRILHVDSGEAANRTVVTFVGEPGEVCEAAFRATERAAQLIDMSRQKGEHPRIGATDVCPLVPVANITMEDTVILARQLAQRIGDELAITVYCYENAALSDERRNLAYCRRGEYEGLAERLALPEWRPDFGPAAFNARAGATAVGAREYLVAYNVNLDTMSESIAREIASAIRESGGGLKSVKAIGWFIEEYGVAQVSMNLTDINVTSVHQAFDRVSDMARSRGVRVTGSELIGLIPLRAMVGAGDYFLKKQGQTSQASEAELVAAAVAALGLDDLAIFNANERILEYAIGREA